jgi:isochorismate synthase
MEGVVKQSIADKLICFLWRLAHRNFSAGAAWPSEAQGHRAIRYKSGHAKGQHTKFIPSAVSGGFPLLSLAEPPAPNYPETLKEAEVIKSLISQTLEHGGAFSLWRMPRSEEKVLFICNSGINELDEISLEESEPGFVFAPFRLHQKKIFLKADLVFKFKDDALVESPSSYQYKVTTVEEGQAKQSDINYYTSKNNFQQPSDYQKLVAEGIRQIEAGVLEKIVPSRFKEVELPKTFDLLQAFDSLCDKHPNAMVSLFSSPNTGTWLGATPELLVSIDRDSKFKTHALAGTLPYSPDINLKSVAWTQKEIEEQALVCRYIINCFKKIRLREYQEHGPKTIVAGNVMHLKTDYEVDMKEVNFPQLGSVMLKLLHPTSAVCGMPLEASMKFLEANEGYDREFYSGYLGPVNYQNESSIFVNLRCMQLLEDKARLYAGAGVTIDSIPEKEWEETEMKMRSLLGVLGNH